MRPSNARSSQPHYGTVQSSATLINQVGLHRQTSSLRPRESCGIRTTRVGTQLLIALGLSLAVGLFCDWLMKFSNLDHKLLGTKHSNVEMSDLAFGLSAIIIFKSLAWLFLKTGWFNSLHDHYIQPIAAQYLTARQHQTQHPVFLPPGDLEADEEPTMPTHTNPLSPL